MWVPPKIMVFTGKWSENKKWFWLIFGVPLLVCGRETLGSFLVPHFFTEYEYKWIPLNTHSSFHLLPNHWIAYVRTSVWNWTSGWWFQPLWKIWINWYDYSQHMEQKKCSKPPTRHGSSNVPVTALTATPHVHPPCWNLELAPRSRSSSGKKASVP